MIHIFFPAGRKCFLLVAISLLVLGLGSQAAASGRRAAEGAPVGQAPFLPSATPSVSNEPIGTEVPNPGGEPVTPVVQPQEGGQQATGEPSMSPAPTPAPSAAPSKKVPVVKRMKVQLKQVGNRMKLSWKGVSGAARYQVERKKAGGSFKKFKKGKKKKFFLKYTAGKRYQVRVFAYNRKNKKIAASETYEYYVPGKTSRINAFYKSSNIAELSWKPVKKASYYLIYRKKANGKAPYRKIKQTGKCQYTDAALSGGKQYRYQVRAVYKERRMITMGKAVVRVYDTGKIVACSHQKYSYEEMADDINSLVKKYPGIVRCQTLGSSEDGRRIYDVVLGNPGASKSILVVSTLHAREYMASLVCMNQIEYYARNYREERDGEKMGSVFDRVCIHYISMANPDGVAISQRGTGSIRSPKLRKRLKKIAKGVSTDRWKANARGVDLNDNFPYQFRQKGSAGSSGYSGAKAASSREAKVIVNRLRSLKSHNLKAVVNYHAMGSIVFGSYSGASTYISTKTAEMYQTAREVTGYASAASYSSGTPSSGGLREYVMYSMNLPSITLEVGRQACPGPISEFPGIWRENTDLLYEESKLFLS